MDLPLGWYTDLAVLRLSGSTVEERPGHLVVRSPANPLHHWGNFILVTDATALDEVERWVGVFEEAFPGAAHRAIGLVEPPTDENAWSELGLVVEHDDVLATDTVLEPTEVPQGYLVKEIADAIEWEQSAGLHIREFAGQDPREARFERKATRSRSAMVQAGRAAWFGAFHGDRLVAELGIVDCGDGVARYQSVVTGAEHRRRGLAGHLLGVAAAWAADRGARTWVIVAERDTDADRLYRSRGFSSVAGGAHVYRRPAPEVATAG